MGRLTEAQRRFLNEIAYSSRPVTRSELRTLASREEDKVRQSCRRAGLVEYVGGKLDSGPAYKMGWRITPAGRAALEAEKQA